MKHSKELHPSRYVFRGQASGVAAHIRRPKDALLAVKSSAVLPAIGGYSESKVGRTKLGKWVSFVSAQTSAHGDYVSAARGLATTLGKPFHEAPAETRVIAKVRGLSILGRVRIANLSLGMVSRTARGAAQPPIRLEGSSIEGVVVDGAKLKVKLAESFYSKNNTKALLQKAHQSGLPKRYASMLLPSEHGVEEVTAFPEANDTVKCTIVESLAWEGKPHPNAEIHGHVLVVPGLGKIYFGEMFVTSYSRRLTMVRFQLGSDDGGEVTGGEGESGTQTFPPSLAG